MKNIAKIPPRSKCDPKILRIYDLIVSRRKVTNENLSAVFGIKNWSKSSAKWRYIQAGLDFLDLIGSDDDLYHVCGYCHERNPFDLDGSVSDEEAEQTRFCEFCKKPLFDNIV